MSLPLGPFDRRIQRTRCYECIRGHVKCEGGFPCKKCLRTCRTCTPPKSRNSIIRFDHHANHNLVARSKSVRQHVVESFEWQFLPDLRSRYITHLFSSFLPSNSFSGKPTDRFHDVSAMLQASPGLYNAAIAVSALNFRDQSTTSQMTELADHNLDTNDSVLWSTFFLGIFELMYDVSGEGWIRHILYGTAKLLQFRGPNRHLTGSGRRFFLTVRIFEISRALLYATETFLAQRDWRALMNKMWLGDDAKDWHPKEALFDLMISCLDLNIRAQRLAHNIRQSPNELYDDKLRDLASEGTLLQVALSDWKATALMWSSNFCQSTNDSQMALATTYHHATRIYLSGTFDYHLHWASRQIPTPSLPRADVDARVKAILDMVDSLLKQGNLAGILFLFPLRVAGARARNFKNGADITRMLSIITSRGFVVADAITLDLGDLWARTGEVTEVE